jgi:hypothetical protein
MTERPAPAVPSLPPESDATPRAVWLLLGTIAAAKLGTVVVVLWLSHSLPALALVGATVWFWLPVAAALLAGPLLFRRRLRRVRARREALRRAEWMLDDPRPAPARPRPDPAR